MHQHLPHRLPQALANRGDLALRGPFRADWGEEAKMQNKTRPPELISTSSPVRALVCCMLLLTVQGRLLMYRSGNLLWPCLQVALYMHATCVTVCT